MSILLKFSLAAGLLCACSLSASAVEQLPDAGRPVKVVLVGDSTVCEYAQDRRDRGWGMFIAEYFNPGSIQVVNLAKAGRSTKTFLQEGRWAKALEEKSDYVLIQFGHNDSHAPDKPESTDAATTYRENLRRYIDEARAAGVMPILVTPMVRREFDSAGKLNDQLGPYAKAMKEVGAEKGAPVLDLHAASWRFVEQLGSQGSREFSPKRGDITHFNEKGARAMVELLVQELRTQVPELSAHLKEP